MEYTSQKIDYEKLQENIKKNGFSDKAKKTISSILLATQILGVMPNLSQAQDIQAETQNVIQDVQKQDNKKKFNLEGIDIDGKLFDMGELDASKIYSANINLGYVDIDGNQEDLNIKINNPERAVEDWGNIPIINRDNIEEFKNRDNEKLKELYEKDNKTHGGNCFLFNNLNEVTEEKIQQAKDNGYNLVFLHNSTEQERENR